MSVPLNAGRCGSIEISWANTGKARNTNIRRIMRVLSQPPNPGTVTSFTANSLPHFSYPHDQRRPLR